MAKKEKGNPRQITETAAGDTLATHPNQSSRASMMLDIVNLFQHMDADKMTQALENVKTYADKAPDASEHNKASVAMKGNPVGPLTQAMKEDMAELFGSQELSEEFKTKAGTLFEAAVNVRVITETARLEEEFNAKLEEQVEGAVGELVDQVDKYVTLAAEEFMEKNQVAIDTTLRSEIAEDFIGGLHKLFAEHYMTIPDDKIDVVEALTDRVSELEAAVNEKTDEILQMSDVLEQYAQREVFDEVSEGLALTQVDKLKKLSEGVEFTGNVDEYKAKLHIIKEHNFTTKSTKQNFEETQDSPEGVLNEVVITEPQINSYMNAISRTAPRK